MWIKLQFHTRSFIGTSIRIIKLQVKRTTLSRNTSYVSIIPLVLCCVSLGTVVIGLIAGIIAHIVRKSRKSSTSNLDIPETPPSKTQEYTKTTQQEVKTSQDKVIQQEVANNIARLNTNSLLTVYKNMK